MSKRPEFMKNSVAIALAFKRQRHISMNLRKKNRWLEEYVKELEKQIEDHERDCYCSIDPWRDK